MKKKPNIELKFNLKKHKTKKLIQKFNLLKNDYFLFYTNVNNLKYIINNGIVLIENIKLYGTQKYIVWSYSQLHDQTQLELIDSNHNNFWLWSADQNINSTDVSVVGININKLFNNSKKNWKYNNDTSIVSVFENINIDTFEWIMIRNKKHNQEINKLIEDKNLNIKTFYSLDGRTKI